MEAVFQMLAGLWSGMEPLMAWVGLLLMSVVGAIQISPWKGDDKALEDVKKMPVVGDLVAFLLGRSPFKNQ